MNIAIAGGGIGGLVVALNLAMQDHQVDVFEQAEELTDVGAGIQLSPNAMHVLRHIGCHKQLEHIACEPEGTALRHYKTGRSLLFVPMHNNYRQLYNAPYLHVHRADLIQILAQAAHEAGVGLHLSWKVQSYEQDKESVRLKSADGRKHTSQLLVGADGLHSTTKDLMLGAESPSFTGYVAWRGLVPADSIPQKQKLEAMAHVWLGARRHFVAYYVRNMTLINFIAVEQRTVQTEESWSQQGDIADARKAFSGWEPRVDAILEAAATCHLWSLLDRAPLSRWSSGRVVLLGDACHPMLPFQAQGAAMAIEDGYVLAQSLQANDCTLGHDQSVRAALVAYEKQRKPRTTMVQKASRGNANFFHADSWRARTQRRVMLTMANLAPSAVRSRLGRIYGVDVTGH